MATETTVAETWIHFHEIPFKFIQIYVYQYEKIRASCYELLAQYYKTEIKI